MEGRASKPASPPPTASRRRRVLAEKASRELILHLRVAVLVEVPVEEVLVVDHGGDEGDHEPARAPSLALCPLRYSTCFHSTPMSSSCMQIAFLVTYGSPRESQSTASK